MRSILIIMKKNAFISQLMEHLQAKNFQIYAEENGKDGLEVARKVLPDIIVASYLLNGSTGTDLCFLVKNSSKLSTTPFILLANFLSLQERSKAFHAGVDAIIASSDALEEIVIRIESLIHNYRAIMQKSAIDKHSLTGQLNDFKLAEIVQMLHVSQKTGILTIFIDRSEGQIAFENGHIKFALFENLAGEPAILIMLSRERGSFIFEKGASATANNIDKPTMQLILDCCQKIDEANFQFYPNQATQ